MKHQRNLCSAFSCCYKGKLDVWGGIGLYTDEARPETRINAEMQTKQSIFTIVFNIIENHELTQKIERIKEKCVIERREAEFTRSAGIEVKTLLAQMMGAVSSQERWRNAGRLGLVEDGVNCN